MRNVRVPLIGSVPSKVPVMHLPQTPRYPETHATTAADSTSALRFCRQMIRGNDSDQPAASDLGNSGQARDTSRGRGAPPFKGGWNSG